MKRGQTKRSRLRRSNTVATSPQLSGAATNTGNLQERDAANKAFGSANFDTWIKSIYSRLWYGTVLDLCCGTGNQLVLFAENKSLTRLVGIDLSKESLAVAEARLAAMTASARCELIAADMDSAFDVQSLTNSMFDVIACSYGLYYSRNAVRLLRRMRKHLAPGGAILIIGPHGQNNASLFSLLQRHLELPKQVEYSATAFMGAEVIPTVMELGLSVEQSTFVNQIEYPNTEAVLKYWRASTFHNPVAEPNVARDLEEHFRRHDRFVVEKHVMAIIARSPA